jgi:lysophospholipase L1-like esterase
MTTTEPNHAPPSPGRISLLGDSTVADLGLERGIYGWGQFFGELFPEAAISNFAVSGASTKSFLTLDSYQEACAAPSDYWLIQFGHNDMKDHDPARFTEPATTYPENLRTMIAAARALGAQPILVTSPHRLSFDESGVPTEELLPYVNAMKIVAEEDGLPLIDLHALSGGVIKGLGPDRVAWITATDKGDNTHFTALGARLIGTLVAQALQSILRERAGT